MAKARLYKNQEQSSVPTAFLCSPVPRASLPWRSLFSGTEFPTTSKRVRAMSTSSTQGYWARSPETRLFSRSLATHCVPKKLKLSYDEN
ncbi:hypothetical protein K438DRAFT_1887614, partial [Mycena galopus ATCC 62051]